ncbi:hypothetical protein M0R72_03915 [Candidatus Pacearchaeota archaeon]|jgi:hypothetical protein|nr:hypothetical protein [Candidatus Pacearchaeota archaeon]
MKKENKISSALAKRLEKLRADAEKKIASQKKEDYSKEIEESKALGREQGKKYEEIEQCYKIIEEFKVNPPILYSTHVNGKLVEQHYDEKFAKKVEMLKRNNSSFNTAVHHISTFGVTFKVFGKAYIQRGAQKISLAESNIEQTVLLKDKDILGTEKKSYIYEIRDGIPNDDNHSTDMIIYPQSEMRFYIDEKTTNPAPAFMVPSKVPDAIKKNSKSTVTQQTVKNIELLNGIFYVNLRRRKRDVNNLLKINSKYPRFSFQPSSNLYKGIIDDAITKMEKENPNLSRLYKDKIISSLKKSSQTICDEISAVIELCKDGSVVITRALNSVLHSNGKETKKIMKDIEKPIKITLTRSTLYDTDTSIHPDKRIFSVAKIPLSLPLYIGSIDGKKGIEESLEKKKNSNVQQDAKAMITDAEEMLKNAKEMGDKELIEMAKIRLETNSKFASGKMQEISSVEKENLLKALKKCEEQITTLKPLIENEFPGYSAPIISDAV